MAANTTATSAQSLPKSSSTPKTSILKIFDSGKERATATHIFFWGGDLSNWSTSGPGFSGARCLELMIPELEAMGVEYPDLNSFTTKLLSDHNFNCAEQWMMVMKGWFFERDLELGNWIVAEEEGKQFQQLKSAMYAKKTPKNMVAGSKEELMWESTTCEILRTTNPRKQKALGRQTRGFDAELWSNVNMTCVTAACIARAEVEPVLRKMYLSSGKRQFVEGSPFDTVWGVGLFWKDSVINDPANWVGENRLGRCHDRAAVKIREMVTAGIIQSG